VCETGRSNFWTSRAHPCGCHRRRFVIRSMHHNPTVRVWSHAECVGESCIARICDLAERFTAAEVDALRGWLDRLLGNPGSAPHGATLRSAPGSPVPPRSQMGGDRLSASGSTAAALGSLSCRIGAGRVDHPAGAGLLSRDAWNVPASMHHLRRARSPTNPATHEMDRGVTASTCGRRPG
jgi:hypothetical protein